MTAARLLRVITRSPVDVGEPPRTWADARKIVPCGPRSGFNPACDTCPQRLSPKPVRTLKA